MHLHRALTACPYCNRSEEVWFYKSLVSPTNTIQCSNCNELYEASSFIYGLINLYNNSTVSIGSLVT